jgi:asparagine synthase (glutamine-hydrolysing)
VLSGDGGDELFAGYDWYVADRIDSYYRQLPPIIKNRWLPRLTARVHPTSRKKGLVNKFKRFVDGADFPPSLRHFRWNCFVSEQDKRHLYTEDLSRSVDHAVTCARFTGYLDAHQGADPLWREQFADIKTYLPDDILAKVDRMSMANSLEARTPFLDYRVVEFVMGLPSHLKLNGLTTKYILKRCMAERLPRAILRRTKQGFSIPMKNWLKRELRPILEDILSPEHINQEGWFNPAYVEKLKTDHFQGIANRSHQLWSLMVLHIWRDAYLRD